MALDPSSLEFQTLYWLTITILITKGIIVIFLGKKILSKRKESGAIAYDFLFGVFMLMFFLLVSRISYFIFDFYLTQFDVNLYHSSLLIVSLWKIGSILQTLGVAIILYIIDRKGFNFKFKGIVPILMVIMLVLIAFYPVSTEDNFEFVSTIHLITGFACFLLPFIFIYLGSKSTGTIKRHAWLLAIGEIIYILGSIMVNEFIVVALNGLLGGDYRIFIQIFSTSMKVIGLILLAIGASRFTL